MDETVHCMVDIETQDTDRTGVILSLGAMSFSWKGLHDQFYEELSIQDQLLRGRTQSASTMQWWSQQPEPRPNKGTVTLAAALDSFHLWYKQQGCKTIWCKGLDFDIEFLKHAFASLGLQTPWKYNEVRDFRTVKKLFPIDYPKNLHPHHALEDAAHQAKELLAMQGVYHFKLA